MHHLPQRLSEPGPILTYLTWLRSNDAKMAEKVIVAIRALMLTSDGLMLLELLEKCTRDIPVPILSDTRALEARNAQSFIPLDLRRILSDETEQLLQRQTDASARREPRTRRT